MRSTLLVLGSFLLLSCASTQTQNSSSLPKDSAKHHFTVVATMNRHLNLEPCGCTFHPQGGLEWESNQWQEWKEKGLTNSLFVTGGNTFEYTDPFGAKLTKTERFTKAGFLVEGLNILNLQGMGMVASDFQFSLSQLKTLKAQSKFTWISTNLKSKSQALFVPYQIYEKDGVPVAVFSLSKKPEAKLPGGIQWVPPAKAFQEALAQLPRDKKYFVVVLANISSTEREAILKDIPGVNFWVGQEPEKIFSLTVDAVGKNTVYVHPEYFGRHYARVDVATNGSWDSFKIPAYEAEARPIYEKNLALLNDIERQTASQTTDAARESLEADKAYYKSQVDKYLFVGEAANPNAASLTLSLTSIDSTLNHGKNSLTELVERYHQKVQEMEP